MIRIERGAKARHRHHTFHHEWMHACLDDSGISQLLSDHGCEALCEAYASARIAEGEAAADQGRNE